MFVVSYRTNKKVFAKPIDDTHMLFNSSVAVLQVTGSSKIFWCFTAKAQSFYAHNWNTCTDCEH
jgi:hypothetical protein